MAGIFGSLFGGAPGNTNGGSSMPSAFMSPPNMTPQQFAMLLAMQSMPRQNGQGALSPGGPQLPQPGANPGAAGAIPRLQQNFQGLNNSGGMSLQQLLQLAQIIRARGFAQGQPFGGGAANPQPQSVSG